MRVFVSRFNQDLKPGDGALINWQIGERTLIVSGQDEGRMFVIQSEGRSHREVPNGLVREGYFAEDPTKTIVAKSESAIWFLQDPREPYDPIVWIERV